LSEFRRRGRLADRIRIPVARIGSQNAPTRVDPWTSGLDPRQVQILQPGLWQPARMVQGVNRPRAHVDFAFHASRRFGRVSVLL
jgi:hypothetical protein